MAWSERIEKVSKTRIQILDLFAYYKRDDQCGRQTTWGQL